MIQWHFINSLGSKEVRNEYWLSEVVRLILVVFYTWWIIVASKAESKLSRMEARLCLVVLYILVLLQYRTCKYKISQNLLYHQNCWATEKNIMGKSGFARFYFQRQYIRSVYLHLIHVKILNNLSFSRKHMWICVINVYMACLYMKSTHCITKLLTYSTTTICFPNSGLDNFCRKYSCVLQYNDVLNNPWLSFQLKRKFLSTYLELHDLHWNTYQRIPFLIRYTGAFIHTYVG